MLRLPRNDMVTLRRIPRQANRTVKKISTLVADLLNVSRLREGQLALNKAPFDLTALICETVQSLQQAASVPIIFEYQKPVIVNADSVRIEQVLVNFINNAIKYAAGSPLIAITLAIENKNIRVKVTDKGPGIAPEKLPFIFERYYRATDTGVQYSGLGLGLYISSEIIKRHGGEIGADSEIGFGSSFWFTLLI